MLLLDMHTSTSIFLFPEKALMHNNVIQMVQRITAKLLLVLLTVHQVNSSQQTASLCHIQHQQPFYFGCHHIDSE